MAISNARKAVRLALALCIGGLLFAAPASRWWRARDIESLYRFVENHKATAQLLKCPCGCADAGHSTLTDCFFYDDPASTRNLHAET